MSSLVPAAAPGPRRWCRFQPLDRLAGAGGVIAGQASGQTLFVIAKRKLAFSLLVECLGEGEAHVRISTKSRIGLDRMLQRIAGCFKLTFGEVQIALCQKSQRQLRLGAQNSLYFFFCLLLAAQVAEGRAL